MLETKCPGQKPGQIICSYLPGLSVKHLEKAHSGCSMGSGGASEGGNNNFDDGLHNGPDLLNGFRVHRHSKKGLKG